MLNMNNHNDSNNNNHLNNSHGSWNRLGRFRRNSSFLEIQLESQLLLLENRSLSPVARINASREIRTIMTCQLKRVPIPKIRRMIMVIHKLLAGKTDEFAVYENLICVVANLACDSTQLTHEMAHRRRFIASLAYYLNDKFPVPLQLQVVYALSNFAADCDNCRTQVRKSPVFMKLLNMLSDPSMKAEQLLIWAIHNIVKPTVIPGTHLQSIASKNAFLLAMQDQLYLQNGTDNVIEALLTIKDALDENYEMIQYVSRHEAFLHRIVECFSVSEERIALAALKVCGSIAFGDDGEVLALLKCDFLGILKGAFVNASTEMQVQILFALSNLCASKSKNIIKRVVDEKGILDMIAQNCYDQSGEVRKEAVFCALNLISSMTGNELHTLLYEFAGQVFFDTIRGFGSREAEMHMMPTARTALKFLIERMQLKDEIIIDMLLCLDFNEAVINRKTMCFNWLGSYNGNEISILHQMIIECDHFLTLLNGLAPRC